MSYLEGMCGQILILRVKSVVLDPVIPRGPKIEDQGPWKIGVTKIFFLLLDFFLTNKLSFETLNITIGPQLLLPDPKNPPKNPKGAWEISG